MARRRNQRPIEEAAVTVDPASIRPRPPHRTAWVQFRVTQEEKRAMLAVAQELGVDLSEYFRQLHRQAMASLKTGAK